MNDRKLDGLLQAHFERPIKANRLNRLESDVWQRIAARKIDAPMGWYERLLAMIFAPQYRLAPIAMAAVIGITVGVTTFSLPAPKEVAAAEILKINVFSSQSGYLLSSNLKL